MYWNSIKKFFIDFQGEFQKEIELILDSTS